METTAFNLKTMTFYSGKNAGLVSNGNDTPPAFATFLQYKDMGYQIRKGAKSVAIFCGYRPASTKDKADKIDTNGKVPIWARVFDICDTTATDDKDFMAHLKKEIAAGKIAKPIQ